MRRIFIVFIVSIVFLLLLSVVDSATNAGEILLSSTTGYFQGQPNLQLRMSVLQEVNRVRATCGFPAYQMHPSLMASAQRSAEAVARSGQQAGHPHGLNGPHGFRYFQQNSGGAFNSASGIVSAWMQSGREDYGGPNGCHYLGDRGKHNQGGHRSNILANRVYKFAGVGAARISGGYTITLDIGG